MSFQQVKIACLQYDHTMQLFEGAVKIRRMLHPNQGDRTAENCLLQMCHRLIRLILRAAIFDERVVGRIPSSSAAPSDP